MSDIQDLLALIMGASRGDQVRDSIVDAIFQCYQDGKAGTVDLVARNLINGAMNVNEQQEAEIAVLQAIVEELQGGGSGGEGTSGTITTEIPTLTIDFGTIQQDVNANATKQVPVTFSETFTEAPTVFCVKQYREGINSYYSQLIVAPIRNTITTSGFTMGLGNKYSSKVSPTVLWIAFQKTTTTISTDITVPATDDLTEEQIQSLIGLLD